MKLAFVYAGQGSQCVGMGKSLCEAYPEARETFENAALDFDLKSLCFEGPMERLSQTAYTQPCMVAVAIAATKALLARGVAPCMAAGLSLGEYSALYAAGVFSEEAALSLVRFRGLAMESAVRGVESAMVAVLGLSRELLLAACEEASALGVVQAANFNCPGQIVIGGEAAAVNKAAELALAAGAKRALPLNVSGPFHTTLMEPASKALAEKFPSVTFGAQRFPVVFNATGLPLTQGEALPGLLTRQVMSPVLFEDSVRYMEAQGVDTIIEIGPGKALSGFVKKTSKSIAALQVEDAPTLEAAVRAIREAN